MSKIASFVSLAGITLSRDAAAPLYQQLYEQIRHMILSGVLMAGVRLPPTRTLCYVIVPPLLCDAFIKARSVIDRGSSTVTQMALVDFMAEGHFSRHIRRLRVIYARRQQAALAAIQALCRDVLTVRPFPAGIHLLAWLPEGWDDQAIAAALTAHGFATPPLSGYSLANLSRGGLVIGYAAYDETMIWASVKKMAQILTENENP